MDFILYCDFSTLKCTKFEFAEKLNSFTSHYRNHNDYIWELKIDDIALIPYSDNDCETIMRNSQRKRPLCRPETAATNLHLCSTEKWKYTPQPTTKAMNSPKAYPHPWSSSRNTFSDWCSATPARSQPIRIAARSNCAKRKWAN